MIAPATVLRKSHDESLPLVVDVDGTLIRSDLLHEATLGFIARNPHLAWQPLAWLIAGKPRLKSRLADVVDCHPETLPLTAEVLQKVREAQETGRRVYLASASERRYVEAVAAHVGGFEGVFATDGAVNLSGSRKAAALIAAFGNGGYDYIGDSPHDLPVWRAARRVIAVCRRPGFAAKVRSEFPEAEVIIPPQADAAAYIRLLRPYQWAKNLLVFLPLLAGHMFTAQSVLQAILAFACFCTAASSAYVVNDLLDIPGDRHHPRKRGRPFASGTIPIVHGPPIAVFLLTLAAIGCTLLPAAFAWVLALYMATTLAYSFVFKRHVLIDVFTLAGLYTLRVLGGVTAVGAVVSPWLLMFSLFLFLCLAIVKRCSELIARREAGQVAALGRGYRVQDIPMLLGLGAAAGYSAVLVIALYIGSQEVRVLYAHPLRLWLLCPMLLYWISRTLTLANRDELHDDPVIFAFLDRVSWIVGLLAGAIVIAAI